MFDVNPRVSLYSRIKSAATSVHSSCCATERHPPFMSWSKECSSKARSLARSKTHGDATDAPGFAVEFPGSADAHAPRPKEPTNNNGINLPRWRYVFIFCSTSLRPTGWRWASESCLRCLCSFIRSFPRALAVGFPESGRGTFPALSCRHLFRIRWHLFRAAHPVGSGLLSSCKGWGR